MEYRFAMAVSQTLYDLFKKAFGDILFKPPSPPDVVEQIPSRAQLNNEQYMLLGLKVLIQSYNILMPGFLEHDHLLHDLLGL